MDKYQINNRKHNITIIKFYIYLWKNFLNLVISVSIIFFSFFFVIIYTHLNFPISIFAEIFSKCSFFPITTTAKKNYFKKYMFLRQVKKRIFYSKHFLIPLQDTLFWRIVQHDTLVNSQHNHLYLKL